MSKARIIEKDQHPVRQRGVRVRTAVHNWENIRTELRIKKNVSRYINDSIWPHILLWVCTSCFYESGLQKPVAKLLVNGHNRTNCHQLVPEKPIIGLQ